MLGSLTATGLEMSTIGRDLRVPAEGERHVFSNSNEVFTGMRVAIFKGLINPDDLVVFFNHTVDGNEQTDRVYFDKSARSNDWPKGFFDQYDDDLSELLGWNEPQ
ncbi:hypothetical protein D3C81_2029760 [compost metagenome]